MKAKLRLRIDSMSRENEGVSPGAIVVFINASGDGAVAGETDSAGKALAGLVLQLKPPVADLLQFGQTLFVTVSTENEL